MGRRGHKLRLASHRPPASPRGLYRRSGIGKPEIFASLTLPRRSYIQNRYSLPPWPRALKPFRTGVMGQFACAGAEVMSDLPNLCLPRRPFLRRNRADRTNTQELWAAARGRFLRSLPSRSHRCTDRPPARTCAASSDIKELRATRFQEGGMRRATSLVGNMEQSRIIRQGAQ